MAKTNYGADSPYYGTLQTSWYLLPRAPRLIVPDSTDLLITLTSKEHERPHVLSDDLYGTPAYWWVFMSRNMDLIRDPIYDFVTGLTLYAPSKDRLTKVVG